MRSLHLVAFALSLSGQALAVKKVETGRNGTADCLSFPRVAVTPAISTFTTTQAVTSSIATLALGGNTTTTISQAHERREVEHDAFGAFGYGQPHEERQLTVSATSTPKYASVCSSTAAYSCACSCIGVRPFTTTATARSTTSTHTVGATVALTTVPPFPANQTSSLGNSTTPRWSNGTSTSLRANSTTSRLTTSEATGSSNSGSSSTAQLTGPLWLNTSMPTLSPIVASSVRWLNTSSTPTPTPSPTVDTSCGETVCPFALQVSQPGGMFDGWYVLVSGDDLLFTSVRDTASSFSVEASGHLCAVGFLDENSRPYIAAVGTRSGSGEVWLLESQAVEQLSQDYAAVKCTKGGSLGCAATNTTNPTNSTGSAGWLGCGLQLDLSTTGSAPVGRGCSSVGLNIV
ncbi:hypothetical protein QBC46DRAFT_368331 [Diplogelasinospora grovesii]|uniref:Uncharacterized protein n=1 Tax=Diplogelasinospora grovesii TaxID=303347 RepID=A0AAN6MXW7_9PEZI|nr:hypothetical protein QBC46DRAFT_368331 [Diplogelasinospora grovesii]